MGGTQMRFTRARAQCAATLEPDSSGTGPERLCWWFPYRTQDVMFGNRLVFMSGLSEYRSFANPRVMAPSKRISPAPAAEPGCTRVLRALCTMGGRPRCVFYLSLLN